MIDISKNILLKDITTYKTGGLADFFAEVRTESDLISVIAWAHEKSLPFFILSGGSNVLFSDVGYRGLIIKLINDDLSFLPLDLISAGAGLKMTTLINFMLSQNLSGLEWASGIPGSLGGSIRGNAGCFGGEISNAVLNLKAVEILNGQCIWKGYEKKDCLFQYRESIFKKSNNLIVWQALLKLEKGDRLTSENLLKEYINKRKLSQPIEYPCAGSVFKNVILKNTDAFLKNHPGSPIANNVIPAGWLIEQCDLKGQKYNQAQISEKHANFIVNLGGATSDDIYYLIDLCQKRVKEKFSLDLETEIQLIGF